MIITCDRDNTYSGTKNDNEDSNGGGEWLLVMMTVMHGGGHRADVEWLNDGVMQQRDKRQTILNFFFSQSGKRARM